MDYEKCLSGLIEDLKLKNQYRTFIDIERIAGAFPKAIYHHPGGDREITVWCSNDYLAMGQNPAVIKAMTKAIGRSGAGTGGSRNISGTNHFHVLLEREVAELHGKESALTFISGYSANDATLTILGKLLPDCVIISDELNHASIIAGIRHSGAEKYIFRHNNVQDLDRLLKDVDPTRPKIVVFESIYSMEGDIAPIEDICAVARSYNALTYLDEVHAVGMYGPQGAGVAAQRGITDQIDLIQGTFAKGFGVVGGYIAGSAGLIDAVRSFASAFIFTTSMPPAIAAGGLASVRHLRASSVERSELHERAELLKNLLGKTGIPMVSQASHIVPVLVGNAHHCKQVADELLEDHDIYVQPVNFPSVPSGGERLRVAPSPLHTPAEVERFVNALDIIWAKHDLPRTL